MSRIKTVTILMHNAGPRTLDRLLQLTNDGDRGDLRDDGHYAGSTFHNLLTHQIQCKHHHSACINSRHFTPGAFGVLAYNEHNVVGWTLINCDRPPFSHRAPTATIGFYVEPAMRRAGVGRRLFGEALEVARKNGMSRIVASPWNARSNSFFAGLGFASVEDPPRYRYPGVYPTVVLELDEARIRLAV